MADQLNPSWRKVLISGSNAHVHEITASGISAAVSNPTLQKVLVYDTNSGAFYYTGSYGSGGGGGTPSAPDKSVQYNDGGAFGGDSGFVFDDTQAASLYVAGPISGSDISGSGTGSFGELEGIIDTSGAQANYRLIFNGSKFVAVPEDTSFEFAINSFGVTGYGSTSQLIGNSSHIVFNSSGLTFSATYNAGPPNSATASIRQDWTPSDDIAVAFSMTSPNYTTGTNTSNITIANLGVSINQNIDFQLTASKGGDTLYSTSTNIYFYNHLKYGASSTQIPNASTILGFSGELLTNSSNYFTGTAATTARTVTVGSGNYLNIALRSSAPAPSMVYCGEDADKLTVAMAATQTVATPQNRSNISYTNDNGYVENFARYSSQITNPSAHSTTFFFSNSTQILNYFFWGTSSVATPDESLVEGLLYADSQYDGDVITGQTLTAIPAFTSKYVYIAIPTRHGIDDTDYQFKLNNFEFDVGSPTTVTITNPVGFQEDYYVYRSNYALTYASPISIVIDTV